MAKPKEYELKIIYSEIIKGSSKFLLDSNLIYVKHGLLSDEYILEEKKKELTEKALSRSIKYEEDTLEFLINKGLWSEEKEREIKDCKTMIKSLYKSRNKLFQQRMIDVITKQISEEEARLHILISHRYDTLGLTVERFVNNSLQHYYIIYNLYKDPDLKERFLTEEEYDEISDHDIGVLFQAYNKTFSKFSETNVKQIAISPFFMEGFTICDNDPLKYYGKSVIQLTNLQIQIFHLGAFFQRVFEEGKDSIPEEYRDDPKQLEEWYLASDARKNIMEKSSNSDGTGVVVTDKKDAKRMGLESNNNINQIMSKNQGKSMSFQEIIKAQGR